MQPVAEGAFAWIWRAKNLLRWKSRRAGGKLSSLPSTNRTRSGPEARRKTTIALRVCGALTIVTDRRNQQSLGHPSVDAVMGIETCASALKTRAALYSERADPLLS